MKIQASIKNSQKKIKEFNNQSKLSQKESWSKEEVLTSLIKSPSEKNPRIHQDYDYVMTKGHRQLKGLTAKFKGIMEESKPFYALMHKNADPKSFWGNEANTCLTSQGFETPNSAKQATQNSSNKQQQINTQKEKTLQISLSTQIVKKLDRYNTETPIKEENIYSNILPGRTTLPPIYPRKIKNRFFQN